MKIFIGSLALALFLMGIVIVMFFDKLSLEQTIISALLGASGATAVVLFLEMFDKPDE